MDPKDFFRGFFGFNHSKQGYPPFGHEDNQNGDRGGDQETFDVFTNPLDMERFFNQQMEAILKNFGMSEGFYSFPGSALPPPDSPHLPHDSVPGSREFMLSREPGIVPRLQPGAREEDDVIESIDKEDLDKLYRDDVRDRGQPFGGIVNPFFFPHDRRMFSENEPVPESPFGGSSFFRSFGQSIVQSRTVKPDGTIEEHRTVRDSSGNETTTVTRISGDQRTTTTTTRKSDGTTQIIDEPTSSSDLPLCVIPPSFDTSNANKLFGLFSSLFGSPSPPKTPRDEMLRPVPEYEQPTYKSMLKKFFGET